MKIFRAPRWRLSPFIGALLAAGLGFLCHVSELGRPLERLSYDLPFPLRQNIATRDVAIVFLDESAARSLGQPLDKPWDRRIFARLLDRLREEGARLVCFDLVFSTPSADAAADEGFARAMAQHSGVMLGGDYAQREQFGVQIGVIEKPTPVLRQAQAGWGLLIFRPIDPDGAVRQICLQFEGAPSLAMAAASRSAPVNSIENSELHPIRWLNYYGPVANPLRAFPSLMLSGMRACRQDSFEAERYLSAAATLPGSLAARRMNSEIHILAGAGASRRAWKSMPRRI